MKLPLAVLITVLSSAVQAQTGGLPPEQAPAGSPQKFVRPSSATASSAAGASAPNTAADSPSPSSKPATKAQRRAVRKEKRDEKVGPKPLD